MLARTSSATCSRAGMPKLGSRRKALALGARAWTASALIATSSSVLGSFTPTAAYIRFSVLRWSIATTAKVPSSVAMSSRDDVWMLVSVMQVLQ